MLKQLYSVAHSTDYGRRQGKKQQPKVVRAKLDNGDVIVGEASVSDQLGFICIEQEPWALLEEAGSSLDTACSALPMRCFNLSVL